MSKSLPFIKPINEALPCLKSVLDKLAIKITNETVLPTGFIKLHMVYQNKPFALILYTKKSTGQSTTIVLENETSDIVQLISSNLECDAKQPSATKIPIHAAININTIDDINAIENRIRHEFTHINDCTCNEHQKYVIDLTDNGQKLKITQYRTGKLLIQGSYSLLTNKVYDLINSIKPLTIKETALFYVPQNFQDQVNKTIKDDNESVQQIENDIQSKLKSNVYQYLNERDRIFLKSGHILIEAIKSNQINLPDFGIIVVPYAKAFEGFLINLLLEKGIIVIEDLRKDPNLTHIGQALNDEKLKPFLDDQKRNAHVLDELSSIWKGVRCKYLHSDPIPPMEHVIIRDLADAEKNTIKILAAIENAHRHLVEYGVKKNSDIITSVTLRKTNNLTIGTDESGKGDYLGPLVIAGVCIDNQDELLLKNIGVKDSKLISDKAIYIIADEIRRIINNDKISVVLINPERYNSLYKEMGNLNHLLAWGHARVIENLLINNDCHLAIADQFGDEEYIKNALMDKGKKISLKQETKAEQYIPVAAASILAREAFLKRLESLSMQFGIEMPKGANEIVEKAAKRFIEKHGKGELSKIAKIHFKTTKRVLP